MIFTKMLKWSEVTQLCPTLCNPMDCSLPGSSVHGIFQARVLEWGAIAFSVNTAKMAILSKLIYSFNAIAYQTPSCFFDGNWQADS